MAMAYLVGGAISPSWEMIELKSMGFGWHPIYEMENNPFVFETTNQLLRDRENMIFCPKNGRIPMAMKQLGKSMIKQEIVGKNICSNKHLHVV
jgi:hypothetical protein